MATMAVVLFAMILLAVAIGGYGVTLYNALVGVKHQVDQAWSNIDVLLKQRHDELHKLIDVVKSHVGYERTFEITEDAINKNFPTEQWIMEGLRS